MSLENLNRINKKLLWLKDKPQGVLYDHRSSLHRVVIIKDLSQIQLYFANPFNHKHLELSGIMSRIDLEHPLNLLGIYTQAMMLSLIWKQTPQRIYMLGFAGGRIPMLLHHYFPDAVIESTDIEELVADIAQKYFGITFDNHQMLYLQDGREYLEKRSREKKFDIVIIDAFRGTGRIPYKFSTLEFYKLCKEHMAPDGVACMNIIDVDSLFVEKVNTFRSCFQHVFFFVHEGAYVVFGTDQNEVIQRIDRERIAELLQRKHQFEFPYFQRALALDEITEQPKYMKLFGEKINTTLSDKTPPVEILQQIPNSDPIFYKTQPNERCPCGSGRKYKQCHGRKR